MSTRFTAAGLVHEHSEDCSHSIDRVIEDRITDAFGKWSRADALPHQHSWWTEEQTGHTHCAYCTAHKTQSEAVECSTPPI